MRKGVTLVELIGVLTVLAIVSLALAPVHRALLTDIPRAERLTSVNASVVNMLRQMRKDVDAAVALPGAFGAVAADEQRLLVELPAGVICYQLEDGKVTRRRLGGRGPADTARSTWELPGAEIRWRVWKKAGKGYAVELRTGLRYAGRSGLHLKLANSRVYFLGSLSGRREKT